MRTLSRPRIQKGSGYRGGVKPEGEITILEGIWKDRNYIFTRSQPTI